MTDYGKELILDLRDCDPSTFTREHLTRYFVELCELIQMERGDLHFWDDVGVPLEEQQANPKTKGTSAIQFILTSNITVHTLDLLMKVFINVFSCKDFDAHCVTVFSRDYFKGQVLYSLVARRR